MGTHAANRDLPAPGSDRALSRGLRTIPVRLPALCEGVMEACWLAALAVLPLFFNVYSARIFDPDKTGLMRSLALVALAALLLKSIVVRSEGESRVDPSSCVPALSAWRHPLVWLALAGAAVHLLSAALSIVPSHSFWGSYHRLQGTLTLLGYTALLLAVLDSLRTRTQWDRVQYAVIVSSVPVALYALLQHLRLDPLPWNYPTWYRAASSVGNPIFVAAYLVMVVPLTVARLVDVVRAGATDGIARVPRALLGATLLVVLVVQHVGIVLTQSRGPVLALATGAFFFSLLALVRLRLCSGPAGLPRPIDLARGIGAGLLGGVLSALGLLMMACLPGAAGVVVGVGTLVCVIGLYAGPLVVGRGWRWLWIGWVTQAAILAAVLAASQGSNVLDHLCGVPHANRLAHVLDLESRSGRARLLTWQSALELLFRRQPSFPAAAQSDSLGGLRSIVGYGPESVEFALGRYLPPELLRLGLQGVVPDRCHNETLDVLVSTGLLGFVVYSWLFGALLYYGLRWLGLVEGHRDRVLFIARVSGSSAVGALLPALLGAPHFGAIGAPLGFLLGVVAHVVLAALTRRGPAPSIRSRDLVLIAVLAAIVAHFVEVQFGIPVTTTRVHFFVFTGVLVAVGTRRLQFETGGAAGRGRLAESDRWRDETRSPAGAGPRASGRRWPALSSEMLPHAWVTALLLVVLNWDFISNQAGPGNAGAVFLDSWVTRAARVDGAPAARLGAGWLVLATIVVGAGLALPALRRTDRGRGISLGGVAVFFGAAVLPWLVHGLAQSGCLLPRAAIPFEDRANRVAGHLTTFHIWLGVLLVLLAASVMIPANRTDLRRSRRPVLSLVAVIGLLLGAWVAIRAVDLDPLRADVFFQLARSADGRRDWSHSLALYQRIRALAPREDYYLPFHARAFLEAGRAAGDPALRAVLLDRAEAVLRRACRLNRLNPDHHAALARFHASRAATRAEPAGRQAELREAVECYSRASSLRPSAAQLHAEWGGVLLDLGERGRARERIGHAVQLDPDDPDSYLHLGRLETEEQHFDAARRAYARAAELTPRDFRPHAGLAHALARLDRGKEAIAANRKALELLPDDATTLQNLALLLRDSGALEESFRYAERLRELVSGDRRSGVDDLIRELGRELEGNARDGSHVMTDDEAERRSHPGSR